MEFYNKFGVFKNRGLDTLGLVEREQFLKTLKKIHKNTGNKTSKYLVIGCNEDFAPAVRELIKAYCD